MIRRIKDYAVLLTIILLIVASFAVGVKIISLGISREEIRTKESQARKLVVSFRMAESDGSIRKNFRSYEGIVNYVIEDLSDLQFQSLERDGLEVEGITSGVVCEYYPGNWVVITNEIIPDADYHSGPAAMLFTTTPPSEK